MLQLVRRCRSEAMRREISSPAVTPRQPRLRSALVVLVVAAPPDARLVAPLGGAVEPLVHAPEAVQSARIGGIGVVDDAVLERERAHARPLARVRGHVGSDHGREGDRPLGGLESILLVDPNPRQLLPPPRQLVAAPRELLLRLEQLEPRCEPLFTCPGHVLRHRSSLLPSGVLGVPGLHSNCLASASVFAPMDVLPRNALAVPAPHRSPLIFSARMPVKCFQPSSWPRPISSSGSPLCVTTRSVAPRDGVISTVTRDSSPRVAAAIHVNSNSRGRSTRR